jgi:hypothetical protein
LRLRQSACGRIPVQLLGPAIGAVNARGNWIEDNPSRIGCGADYAGGRVSEINCADCLIPRDSVRKVNAACLYMRTGAH